MPIKMKVRVDVERLYYEYIKPRGWVTRAELKQLLKVSGKTAGRILKRLEEEGYVVRVTRGAYRAVR